jgi:hypothetical protein
MTEREPSQGMGMPNQERPLTELLVEVWENTERLVRQELRLASAELDVKVQEVKKDLAAGALAGAFMFSALLTLVAALVLLLSEALAPWLSALIVGVLLLVAGYALMRKAREGMKPAELAPNRTARSLKRDVQVFKEAMK